jgi:hypothetical protein
LPGSYSRLIARLFFPKTWDGTYKAAGKTVDVTITIVIVVSVVVVTVIGVAWLMRTVPSFSNAILAFVGLATFLGARAFIVDYEPEFLSPLLSYGPAPDIADLLFTVKYTAAGGGLPDTQKWWTLGTADWVLTGSVVNNSDKDLTKLKFEVFIKYGASIIGDETVVTQRSWKVLPSQKRDFTTYSNTFKALPLTKWNPIWGLKLVGINNTLVKTDIVWSPDNPLSQFDNVEHPASK